jgi:hypothetical protein
VAGYVFNKMSIMLWCCWFVCFEFVLNWNYSKKKLWGQNVVKKMILGKNLDRQKKTMFCLHWFVYKQTQHYWVLFWNLCYCEWTLVDLNHRVIFPIACPSWQTLVYCHRVAQAEFFPWDDSMLWNSMMYSMTCLERAIEI